MQAWAGGIRIAPIAMNPAWPRADNVPMRVHRSADYDKRLRLRGRARWSPLKDNTFRVT